MMEIQSRRTKEKDPVAESLTEGVSAKVLEELEEGILEGTCHQKIRERLLVSGQKRVNTRNGGKWDG